MTTVYSFMKKFEGRKVIEIYREAEEVTIPPTATQICEVACFFGSITSLDLENTQVTIIEKHAFANCYKLEEVRFPSCLEEICEGAFKSCTNLRHISFPSDSRLRIIGNSAFKHCIMFRKLKLPRNIEFIGDSSFGGCIRLILDLRETQLQHIGQMEADCTFYLPSTVKQDDVIKISENSGCHIKVDEKHPVVQRDSCGYYISNRTIFKGNKKSKHVLIRRGFERIAVRCFVNSKLVRITIPSSVTEIHDYAFLGCHWLQQIHFAKSSRINAIGIAAFSFCPSIKKIYFPKLLKIIKEEAFGFCESLKQVVFPQDSQLEKIEGVFAITSIKRLFLPPSVREIEFVCNGICGLESVSVSNDLYQSNNDGCAIFSRDGRELVSVISSLKHFEIPDCVRIIKKRAFGCSSITNLIIPPSVEVIEDKAFLGCQKLDTIVFKEGSRLMSIAYYSFFQLRNLVINNENFAKMENGVVMSMNPRGIVFVPRELTELNIPSGVEVIYSRAFYKSRIKRLKLPKSLKKICTYAFVGSSLESVIFEDGTKLDLIGTGPFIESKIKSIQLPSIEGDLDEKNLSIEINTIEFPPNLSIRNKELQFMSDKIICPLSSLPSIAYFDFNYMYRYPKLVVRNK